MKMPVKQQTGGSVRPHGHGNVRNVAISSFAGKQKELLKLVPPHITRRPLFDLSLYCVNPVSPGLAITGFEWLILNVTSVGDVTRNGWRLVG